MNLTERIARAKVAVMAERREFERLARAFAQGRGGSVEKIQKAKDRWIKEKEKLESLEAER